MTRRPTRRGFTLIELLAAIFIMLILAALAVLFIPHLDRNKGVPNAATQVQGWINLSKQQALCDGAPGGIRIVQDPNNGNPGRGVAIQYIEQPEPIAPRGPGLKIILQAEVCYDPLIFTATSPNPDPRDPTGMMQMPPNCGLLTVVTLVQEDIITPTPIPSNTPASACEPNWRPWEGVDPDDYFELSGSSAAVARIRRFTTPKLPSPPGYPTGPVATGNPLGQFILDRVIDGTEVMPVHLSAGFRVIRSPRPLAGESMLQLHKDVFIDLPCCYPCPLDLSVPGGPTIQDSRFVAPSGQPWAPYGAWSPNQIPAAQRMAGEVNYMDILFNSSGFVANAPTGQLILTLRHIERPNEIVLLTVYTRTGKITAHVIYDVLGADPFAFTRDGKSSGL